MSQPTDITLDGADYMLVPGGYRRSQDGTAEGRTGRILMQDFFGGQNRALQLERDRGWGGIGTGPALDGQGVAPWPHITTATLPPSSPVPDASSPIPTATVNDHVFFALGDTLYRTTSLSASNWSTPVEVWSTDSGVSITSLAWYNNDILIGLGHEDDLVIFQYPSGPANPLLAGERAHHAVSYAGFALWSQAQAGGATSEIRMVTGSGVESRYLDARVTRLTNAGGKVWAASNTSLYSFSGRVSETLVPNPAWTPGGTEPTTVPGMRWSGEWDPFFQHGSWTDADDYTFLLGFGGRLITWLGKRVVEHNPSGDRAGWRDLGLGGRTCLGACVAGGYLVVAMIASNGTPEVWTWNGAGWWLLRRSEFGSTQWAWPVALSGAGNHDVLLFRDGSRTIDLIRLHPRSITSHALATSGSYVTSLLDASERDRAKAWRKVGATLTSLEPHGNPDSTDSVTVALDWSTDAGTTWHQATTKTLTGPPATSKDIDLAASIASDVAVSRWMQLRVRWSSVSDWAPVLTGLWTEFEVLDSPARRRRWNVSVQVQDQPVRRDGGFLDQTATELIASLWAAWESATTLPFTDIDHDADPVERQVRITGIVERTDRMPDSSSGGSRMIELTLVEV